MFERDSSAWVSFLLRHSRAVTMVVAGILVTAALLNGLYTPGWIDFGFVTTLIVRRFGLLQTTLATAGLMALLVALTPPMCGGNRSKAYGAAMKSDLKNLASQQEIYYSDSYMYTTSAADLAFTHSDGVTVTIVSVETGWAAWASHAALGSAEGCGIYYGDLPESMRTVGEVTPTQPGEIVCTDLG